MTSQINPNNVNGNFPIAGVPNNTQGFRDNFTNIKTNFEFAETEIDDLQSKAILKSALAGGTLDNNVGNNLVYNARVQGISGTLVQIANTAGFINIDASAGPYQSIVMGGNINLAFTANTWPSAGSYGKVRVEITGTAGQTITLPAAVTQGTQGIQGINAGVITLAASGTYEFDFSTSDGGASLTVFDLNRPLSYYTNPVTITNTLNSTSSTTGALTVAGGVGINGNLYVGGNIVGNLVITSQSFVGNVTGGNLNTGGVVSATANVVGGNIRTAGQVSAGGNVIGAYIIGDGSQLTNIVAAAGAAITNGTSNVRVSANSNVTVSITGSANVVQWATSGEYVTGLISATGNIIGGNISTNGTLGAASIGVGGLISATGNITGSNVLTGGLISATGNIIGNYILGNGSQLTGLAAGYANSNVSTYLASGTNGSNIITSANISGNYLFGNGSQLTGISTGSRIVSGTTEMAIEVPSGNLQASVGGTANVAVFTPTGANITGYANITGNLAGGNATINGFITASGNITTSVGIISAPGNITGGNILTGGLISATGNLTSANVNATGNVSLTGNVIAGNLTTSLQVVAVGNVTGGNIRTDGQVLALNATAIPSGGLAGKGYVFSTTVNFGIFFGSGVPTLAAAKGSLYLRSDGSTTNDRMYVNTDGATTWTAVTTVA
jgi:subtilase-type serine protease